MICVVGKAGSVSVCSYYKLKSCKRLRLRANFCPRPDLKQVGDQSSLAYPAYARSIAQQAIEIAKPPYEASEVIQPYWLPAACTSSIDHLKPLRDT